MSREERSRDQNQRDSDYSGKCSHPAWVAELFPEDLGSSCSFFLPESQQTRHDGISDEQRTNAEGRRERERSDLEDVPQSPAEGKPLERPRSRAKKSVDDPTRPQHEHGLVADEEGDVHEADTGEKPECCRTGHNAQHWAEGERGRNKASIAAIELRRHPAAVRARSGLVR